MFRIICWGMIGILGSLPMVGCGSSDDNGQDDEPTTTQAMIEGISIVSAPRENGTYGKSEMIMVEVVFSTYVTVSGAPRLTLEIGGQIRRAAYRSGSGTKTLRFGYTVVATDRSSTGITIAANALSVNGGSIVDGGGHDVSLNNNRLTNAVGHAVDGSVYHPPAPVNVRVVSRPIQGNAYGATENIEIEIEFDEAVTVTARPSLALSIGGQARQAFYEGGGGTTTLTFGYTVTDSDQDADGITISANTLSMNGGSVSDADGNGPEPIPDDLIRTAFAGGENLKVDGGVDHPPVVVDVRIASSPLREDVYGIGELIEVDIVFSESVVVGGHPTLALELGSTVRNVPFETGYLDGTRFRFDAPHLRVRPLHLQVRPDLYSKNTHSLTFLYSVDPSDYDADGIGIARDALSLAGGRIFDVGGNHADPDLGTHVIDAATDHKVDGGIDRPPFVTGVTISSSPREGDTYGAYENIKVDVRFSEPVAIRKSDGLMSYISDPSVGRPSLELTLDSSGQPLELGVYYHDFARETYYASEYQFSMLSPHPEGMQHPDGTTSRSVNDTMGGLATSSIDLDGISILADALVLNGGTIQDVNGNDAQLDIGDHAIVNAANHKVDTNRRSAHVVPSSVNRRINGNSDVFRAGDNLMITVRLPHPLVQDTVVSGSPSLAIRMGSKIRQAELASHFPSHDPRNPRFTFRYEIAPDDFTSVKIKLLRISGGEIRDQHGRSIELVFDGWDIGPIDILGEDSPAYIKSASFWAPHTDRRLVLEKYHDGGWVRDYVFGEPIIIGIQASEPVVVEGTPLLELPMGSKTRFAEYRANEDYSELGIGDGSLLFFSYNVHPSDFQRDRLELSQNALETSGGTIKTKSGKPIDLSLPLAIVTNGRGALDAQGGLLVRDGLSDYYDGGVNGGIVRDAELSWAVIGPKPPADKVLRLGAHVYLWAYFSKGVTFAEEPYVQLTIGSQVRRLSLHEVGPASQGSGLLFRYTIGESDFGRIRMPENPIQGTLVDSSGASVQVDLGWRPFGDGIVLADGGGGSGSGLPFDPSAIDGGNTPANPSNDQNPNAFPDTPTSPSYACHAAPTGSPNAVMADLLASGEAPLRLSLDATDSSSDGTLGLASHRWYLNASVLLHDGPGPHEVVLPPGNHRIQLDVTDANGNSDCIEKAIAVGLGDGSAYDLKVYDDRIITMNIIDIRDAFDLDAESSRDREQFVQHISWVLYTYFLDDFDFLLLLFNEDPSAPFSLADASSNFETRAEYHAVQNSIAGLGPSDGFYGSHYDFTAQFGSEGRLQGAAIFGARTMLWDGTGLHEIMHRWGNYMIPTADEYGWRYHWGLSSAYGQLGGFDLRHLERVPRYNDIHGDAYRIVDGGFSPYGAWISGDEGQNRYVDVYSPLELYLMGLAPIDDVPTIWAATHAEPAYVQRFGQTIEADDTFIVSQWAAYDQDRILREFGPRKPPHGQAQTTFKAAVVLLITGRFPPDEEDLQQVSQDVQAFSLRGDDGVTYRTNFWEATGGRATMEMNSLGLSRKAVPTPPTAILPTPAAFERLRKGGEFRAPPIH